MNIGINDLSFRFPFATERLAVDALSYLAVICRDLESETCTKVERVLLKEIEGSWQMAPGKTLHQVLARMKAGENRSYLLGLLVNRGQPIPHPEKPFVWQGWESFICSWARNSVVVSLLSHEIFRQSQISGQVGQENVQIANISLQEHLQEHRMRLGIRRYESNAGKHKASRPNAYGKGRVASPMDLSDQEAQELLNRAIPIKGRLYARKGKHNYTFPNTRDNIYHGYIVDDLGDDILRELNRGAWE